MKGVPRVHVATVIGRWRTDWGLLVLMGLVVALTTALTSAVPPLTERTADRAMAGTVLTSSARSTVVATLPEFYLPPGSPRDPTAAAQVDQDAENATQALPAGLAAVLRPGVTAITTPGLQLQDAGPGRLLQLAYLDAADGPPSVRYTQGGPPRAIVGADAREAGADARLGDGQWTVQVALSDSVAQALDLGVGARVRAEDEKGRAVFVRISGTFVATDEDTEGWQLSPRLLHPVQGVSEGQPFVSAAALVSSDSLPDLRFGLPSDLLTQRVVFTPDVRRLRWRESTSLEQSIVSLQSSGSLARGDLAWDGLLGTVLADGRTQVASARGQAQVLLIGLLATALLVLLLAAQLLVDRRTRQLTLVRQRGATLTGIALELLLESLLVGGLGTVAGLGIARVLVGSAAGGWAVPVLVVAAAATPVLGAAAAARVTGNRVPANRSARRTAARALSLRRLAIEGVVLAATVLAFVALRQRGVVGTGADGGDLTAASAATWWALAGAAVLLRLLPPALRGAIAGTRRSAGGVRFFVAARLVDTGARALPVLVACVAVSQLTLGVALAATERAGQSAAALSAVGGDARLDADPDPALDEIADEIADESGVRAVATGRVEDGVQVASRRGVESVRVVVVDAAAYQQLLADSDLTDAPQLAALGSAGSGPVPALLLGGDDGLRDAPTLLWEDGRIPLDVVGTAPDVDASTAPVLVVDADVLAGAGVVAPPNTVWAVGPGSGRALDTVASKVAAVASVTRYADELAQRRQAPLPIGIAQLAVASCVLLLALAILGSVLAAVASAPTRAQSMGRLRALGLPHRDLRRVLVGELVTPVLVAGLAGLALGVGVSFTTLGSLSLERLTGQSEPVVPLVPWWTGLAVVLLVVAVLGVAALEWRRVKRQALAQLLRG